MASEQVGGAGVAMGDVDVVLDGDDVDCATLIVTTAQLSPAGRALAPMPMPRNENSSQVKKAVKTSLFSCVFMHWSSPADVMLQYMGFDLSFVATSYGSSHTK